MESVIESFDCMRLGDQIACPNISIPHEKVHCNFDNLFSYLLYGSFLHMFQNASFEFKFPRFERSSKEKKSFVFENEEKSTSTSTIATEEFHRFLATFATKIIGLNLKQKDTELIFEMSMNLIKQFTNLNKKWISDLDPNSDTSKVLDLTNDIVYQHFLSYRSTYKQNKILFANKNFVKPIEKAIGTRWEQKKMWYNGRKIYIPRLIQCTLTYVPILKTIKSLFACDEFAATYFQYNMSNGSNVISRDGSKSYTSFSSGTSFAGNELFMLHPDSLQLQIASDEFEPCNALQSKANRHKVNAVYLAIHNMPSKYTSKLNNIFLVSLCNSDDIKSKQTDFNNIWQHIVDEICILETEGIMVGNRNLKGTLVHTSFDNLGANVGLGFSGSFSASKYCRHCLTSNKECSYFTSESQCSLRTLESYAISLDKVDNSESVNLDDTDGVKFYCVLSNLKYFHILTNPTVDIMHDLAEGCIPEILSQMFTFCFNQKIFSRDELDNLIKCYDYGTLNSKNVPSELNVNRRNLGQNAAQSLCLFRNLPFILHAYKNHPKLKNVWKCVETLLEICEIVWSYEISELSIQRLERAIELHLELFKSTFGKKLIPKQHFLLHYARIIRTVGPLRFFEMMRFDAKHRIFKDFRYATKNFIALNKSLGLKHQKLMSISGARYQDNITHGVLKEVSNETILFELRTLNLHESAFETKYLHVNNYKYSKGLLIIHQNSFFEIVHIINVKENFFFLCLPWVIRNFDKFLNSYEIEKFDIDKLELISFSELLYTKSHEIKTIRTNNYVISDSFDLKYNLNQF